MHRNLSTEKMRLHSSHVFLGRQSILDRQGYAVAYELLFRSATGPGKAQITDDSQATVNVVSHAFCDFGISTLVGESRRVSISTRH